MEMNFDKVLEALVYNLKQAYNGENTLGGAHRFFEMALEDIEKQGEGFTNQAVADYDKEKEGHHVMPGDIQLRESFMATRAGALGETFGEAPKLSQCCQQEIVDNDKCSHCGNVCKEMPSENAKLNEAVNKMKKLF